MGRVFRKAVRDTSRDELYLAHRRKRFRKMKDDAKVPAMGYHFSATLRKLNKEFYADPSRAGLSGSAQKLKDRTRAKNTTKADMTFLDLSQFEVSSGLHEWLPTDLIGEIIKTGSRCWMFLFNAMRCPTWLLVLNPEAHHADLQDYRGKIAKASGQAKLGSEETEKIKASDLGLNGHSAGLSVSRTGKGSKQLTQFQSLWHDSLREMFRKHSKTDDFDAWGKELNDFICRTFLFADSTELPGRPAAGPSSAAVMDMIEWDLNLACYGTEPNPRELGDPPLTMSQIAIFLHREWNAHFTLLTNSFEASKHVG